MRYPLVGRLGICLLLAGGAGLAFEIIWMRQMGRVVGNGTRAAAIPIAVYMCGLAIGAMCVGSSERLRRRPLRYFALTQFLVAGLGLATVLASPLLLHATAVAYTRVVDHPRLLDVLRVFLSAAFLLPVTVLLGMGLPLAVAALGRVGSGLPRGVGVLSSAQAIGSMTGVLVASFVGVPRFGLAMTGRCAAAALLAAGGIALITRRPPVSPPAMPNHLSRTPWPRRAALVLSASGCLAMISQLGWIRALSLAFGSTLLTAGTVIAVFILGLGIGSVLGGLWPPSRRHWSVRFSAIQTVIGLWSMGLAVGLGWLPLAIPSLWPHESDGAGSLFCTMAAVSGAVLLVPTILMGMLVPTACRGIQGDLRQCAIGAARLLGANTIGAILGVLVAAYVLLPRYGMQSTLASAAAGSMLLAACVVRRDVGVWKFRILALALPAVLLIPAWPAEVACSAPSFYASSYRSMCEDRGVTLREVLSHGDRVVGSFEDAGCWVTVTEGSDANRTLRIDGKGEVSPSTDRSVLILQSLVPLLVHPRPERVLVVGLGSGTSVRTALSFSLERVDCVEISPAVVQASALFPPREGADPQAHQANVIVEDARFYLGVTPEKYDVITCQATHVWTAGMEELATVEAFENSRRCLRPGGIYVHWIHGRFMSESQFRQIVASFLEVFPTAALWDVGGTVFFLVGFTRPDDWARPKAEGPLPQDVVHWGRQAGIASISDLWSRVLMGPEGLRAFAADARLLTDDRPLDGIQATVSSTHDWDEDLFRALESYVKRFPPNFIDEEASQAHHRRAAVWSRLLDASRASERQDAPGAIEAYCDYLRAVPDDPDVRALLGRASQFLLVGARRLEEAGRIDEAIESLGGVPTESPSYGQTCLELGRLYHLRKGDAGTAGAAYQRARAAMPESELPVLGLANVYEELGRSAEADALYAQAGDMNSRNPDVPLNHGVALARRGDIPGALACWRETLRLEPENKVAKTYLSRFGAGQ